MDFRLKQVLIVRLIRIRNITDLKEAPKINKVLSKLTVKSSPVCERQSRQNFQQWEHFSVLAIMFVSFVHWLQRLKKTVFKSKKIKIIWDILLAQVREGTRIWSNICCHPDFFPLTNWVGHHFLCVPQSHSKIVSCTTLQWRIYKVP